MVQCILIFFENGSKQILEGAMEISKLPSESCRLRLGGEDVRRIDNDELQKPRKIGHEHTCRTRYSEENGSRHQSFRTWGSYQTLEEANGLQPDSCSDASKTNVHSDNRSAGQFGWLRHSLPEFGRRKLDIFWPQLCPNLLVKNSKVSRCSPSRHK